MKRILAIFALIFLLVFVGCRQKYRIYSVGMLDRATMRDFGTSEIADTFMVHSVIVVAEDSMETIIEGSALSAYRMRMCNPYRSDRLEGAVALGNELGVNAIVFSSMPPTGFKKKPGPCPSESLISFFVVDPPIVLFESRDIDDFIYQMTLIDWETVVKPPPPPEEFFVALDEVIKFAGLKIEIVREADVRSVGKDNNKENKGSDKSGDSQMDYPSDKDPFGKEDSGDSKEKFENSADDEAEKESEQAERLEEEKIPSATPWFIVIEDGFHKIHSAGFELRIIDKVPERLRYDVAAVGTEQEPEFKLVLSDLRLD